MSKPDPLKQYELFKKYWEKGIRKEDASAFRLAYDLLSKLIPVLEGFISEEPTDEERIDLARNYSEFGEFLFDYFLLLQHLNQNPSNLLEELKGVAERCLALNPRNFNGAYFLAVYSSWKITRAHAGSGSAIYRGEGAADSIVGTAFNLIGKGLTLGVTAAGAGITKSAFNSNVQLMIDNYTMFLAKSSPSVFSFIEYSSKMFQIAEYCEETRNTIWREIYAPIAKADVDRLDFSEVKEDYIKELADQAEEIQILAHAKI